MKLSSALLHPLSQVLFLFGSAFCLAAAPSQNIDANRLAYLDEFNPFHPHLNFPKLTTPQWVGEPCVEAVIVLSIDDMYASEKYEAFLRPILERLKKIDGRAPVSIFCNGPRTDDPQLQNWLKEGLSFEIHTLHHPCPLLAKGNFEAAANTYHGCVDLLNHVPGNKPVAYRMPCCDSLNTASPRFYTEIFNRANAAGQFLTIDSSVFNITSTNDPALPRNLVTDADGREKFRKYVPFPAYTTTIDDYPYPYQIGKTIWEFPCAVPSDWEAQHLHGTNNSITVADWKSALDATVLKQGVFTLVMHPHGWIRNDQIIELIDYAVRQYGTKIKFLNFREAEARLNKNLLASQPLRGADGNKNGVRLLDLNNDGFMDVVIGNDELRQTRLWKPKEKQWVVADFPMQLVTRRGKGCKDADARFGVVQTNGFASFLFRHDEHSAQLFMSKQLEGAWDFDGTKWMENKTLLNGLENNGEPVFTRRNGVGAGARFRDIDNDGVCEFLIANEKQNAVYTWVKSEKRWRKLLFAFPDGVRITDQTGRDLGLRFVDVNEDGFDDLLCSNEKSYSLHLFLNQDYVGMPRGWSHRVRSGKRGDPGAIPMIVRGGESPNNGAWFRHRTLWVQNENTADKLDLVERFTFDQMLALEAPPAKEPKESLACIKVRPGFKVELVACEPLIESPIAFDWGADGNLWVLEMGDYPLGLDGKGKPGGRVRLLKDTDGDGVYDSANVFLDGLKMPSGLMPWRKGALVAAAPEIFYAEDSNGDGKADVKKVLFTGFHPGNPQHLVNGFEYGLDNWIYGANGDSGGQITSVLTDKTVDINGRDFRFRPDTGEFESESGQTQYGRCRDDWGNWFGNNNPTWLWHYLFPERYIARNPHLPIRENKRFLANYPNGSRVFGASAKIERFNDPRGADHVTAANSPTPYRDDLFGPDFATSVFISEPVHNCVHREVLEPDGTTFKSHRAAGEQQSEFLSSTDNWFRPTMLKTGPDGALYIADMYRLVIEHPEWIPADRQKRIDLRAGADKGRLYRVLPENVKPRSIPNLAKMNTAELVAALDSPNGWQRDTSQRLLVEKQNKSAIKSLEKLVKESSREKSRMQALCALDGLSAITPEILKQAAQDTEPLVQANAVRLSEPIMRLYSGTSIVPGPTEFISGLSEVAGLWNHPDVRVRYQLAFSLGEWDCPTGGWLLARIAIQDWNSLQMQTAIMSSAAPHVGAMFSEILEHENPPSSLIEQLLELAVSMNDEKSFRSVLTEVSRKKDGKYQPWQFSALAGFLDALERRGESLADFHRKTGAELQKVVSQLQPLFAEARKNSTPSSLAQNVKSSLPALSLLGRGLIQVEEDINRLAELLQPTIALEIQKEALAACRKLNSRRVAEVLVANWKILGPDLKSEAIGVLFNRPEWVEVLLNAIEQGEVPAGQIGATQQQALLNHKDAKFKERAAKLFFANADRQKVVKEYASIGSLKGDAAKGRFIFLQSCAPCHRLGNEGSQVGPDLGMISDKPISFLLLAILDPNQAVEARYTSYHAVTKSDREVSGVIVTESANSITLRNLGGTEETILRADLQELKSSGLSLMPEGFESSISPQEMADLIRYLKGNPAIETAKPQ